MCIVYVHCHCVPSSLQPRWRRPRVGKCLFERSALQERPQTRRSVSYSVDSAEFGNPCEDKLLCCTDPAQGKSQGNLQPSEGVRLGRASSIWNDHGSYVFIRILSPHFHHTQIDFSAETSGSSWRLCPLWVRLSAEFPRCVRYPSSQWRCPSAKSLREAPWVASVVSAGGTKEAREGEWITMRRPSASGYDI